MQRIKSGSRLSGYARRYAPICAGEKPARLMPRSIRLRMRLWWKRPFPNLEPVVLGNVKCIRHKKRPAVKRVFKGKEPLSFDRKVLGSQNPVMIYNKDMIVRTHQYISV